AGKPFYRNYFFALDLLDWRDARLHSLAADDGRAGAAVAFTAPVLCAGEPEIRAQHPQKSAVVVGIKADGLAVQIKSDRAFHLAPQAQGGTSHQRSQRRCTGRLLLYWTRADSLP